MLLHYKLHDKPDEHTGWHILFQFSTVSFFLLWLYHLIAFVCLNSRNIPGVHYCACVPQC